MDPKAQCSVATGESTGLGGFRQTLHPASPATLRMGVMATGRHVAGRQRRPPTPKHCPVPFRRNGANQSAGAWCRHWGRGTSKG